MVAAAPADAPASGSALIKALKAPQDPPVPGGPSKIEMAAAAWTDEGLVVPRKADVVRDWIVEAWGRSKAGPSHSLADARYHDLFVAVSPACAAPPAVPLSLLGAYITAAAGSIAPDLASAARPALRLMFTGEPGAGIKAEAWADMLSRLVTALAAPEASNALLPVAEIVCDGLATTLVTAPNAKKVAQSLHGKLPALAAALHHHSWLDPILAPILPTLFFPLGVLQTVEPLKQLVGKLVPSQPTGDVAQLAPSLALVPRLFSAFIDATRQHRYTLYGKSNDGTPVDVVVADRTRGAVIPALAASLDVLNRLEDAALAHPGSSASAPPLALALWSARLQLWEHLLTWGGYLETDGKAGALVATEAKRASAALSMYGASEAAAVDEGLAGKVLRTLDALERLDHARAAFGTDVVGWCLAAPDRCHVPARILLTSLLRFHVLTHSLATYFSLVADAAQGLFDPALPSDTLDPLYALVANGPLTDRTFRAELAAATRGANLGGRRGVVWADILRDLSRRVTSAVRTGDDSSAGSKRKRTTPGSGARLAAVLSRVIKTVLDAGAKANSGDDDVEAAADAAAEAFGDDVPAPGGKKKTSVGGADPGADLVFASRLRVARSVLLLHRDYEPISTDILSAAMTGAGVPELRLQAFHYLYTVLALAPSGDGLDALLSVLDGPAKRAWSGRDASVTDKTLAAASWTLAAESGLTIFEAGSGAQLDGLATTVVARARATPAEGLSVSAAIARVLHTAETWELPSLRSALLRALVAAAEKHDDGTFVVLASCPAPWLSKGTRAALLEAAYAADAASDTDTRVGIRAWLARLASTDILGPLGDASTVKDVLKRVLKSGDATPALADATLALCRAALAKLARDAGSNGAPLEAALKALESRKHASKLDMRTRAAAAFLDAADPTSWPEDVSQRATRLADSVRTTLTPLLDSALADPAKGTGTLHAYRGLLRYERASGQAIKDDTGARLLHALVREPARAPEADLAVVALDLSALAAAPNDEGALAVVATYVVLCAAAPSPALDGAFASYVKGLDTASYAAAASALIPLLTAQRGEQLPALKAVRVLVSAPVQGSGRALADVLGRLLRALEEVCAGTSDARVLDAVLGVLGALVDERTGLLRPPDAATLLAIISGILLPSDASAAVIDGASVDVLSSALAPLHTLARHRADLVLAHLPSVVGALCAAVPLLQGTRPGLRRKRREPGWFSPGNACGNAEAHAALLARTLTALATAKIPSKPGTDAHSRALAGPLAKHAPAVLVSYARAASDPWAVLAPATRRALEPGLFALCDAVTAGGRADGRGREGEGVGVPFGLGDAHGDAEREVWANLWKAWARKRYTGRG